jgi:hydroxymethylpyrimidine/phosphomethylpyrimidine kinase
MEKQRIPAVLSIAGSDSGGGAGIQADLKAFARCGVHGMTAITAITAQNTRAVEAVEPVSPRMVFSQMLAISEDRGADAIKIGMLGSAEAIDAIAVGLTYLGLAFKPVVIDPVMVAESGAELLDQATKEALINYLLPKADVITPNIPEARALTGLNEGGQEDLARGVYELASWEHGQPQAVVVTGGHSKELVDVFFDGQEGYEIHGERHPGGSAHGSGCTHSSALAAFLAHGDPPLEAARKARTVASEAVAAGLHDVGSGPGPVDALKVRGRGTDVVPAPASALPRH